jgi:methionyl-tRNA synthetase
MVDEDIKRRIEKVEDYIPKIFGELSTIRTKVEIPHNCKWEAVIPVLVDFKNKADVRLDKTDKEVEAFKLDKAIGLIVAFGDMSNPEQRGGIVSKLDRYITLTEPYKLIQTDRETTAIVIYNLLENLRQIAWMIKPFMPETSDKIFEQLFADEEDRKVELGKSFEEAKEWGGLKSGTRVKKGEALFPRLEE